MNQTRTFSSPPSSLLPGTKHSFRQMLGSHFSQGAGSRNPSPLILDRVVEILGNTLCTSAGKAAAVAAAPDLLGSLGNLLEHENGQGTTERRKRGQ